MERRIRDDIKYRKNVTMLSIAEITNILGESQMACTLAKFGWRASKGRDMDAQKVDFTYRSGKAIIDIQLKSSNLNKYNRWNWLIYKKGRKKKNFMMNLIVSCFL